MKNISYSHSRVHLSFRFWQQIVSIRDAICHCLFGVVLLRDIKMQKKKEKKTENVHHDYILSMI